MVDATWNCCRLGAFCVHHTIMHQPLLMQSHIRKVQACLAITCHLHFWQNDWDLLRATAVTLGGTDTEIRVSTESWPWRRTFSSSSCRDSNPRPFNHESSALTAELSMSPKHTDSQFFVSPKAHAANGGPVVGGGEGVLWPNCQHV